MKYFLLGMIWCLVWPVQASEIAYHAWHVKNEDGTSHALQLEHATTPLQQGKGLMFRLKLDDDKGMAFIYPKPQEMAMWMKNTYLPLDIIYLNSKGAIVSMHKNATPLSLQSIPSGGMALVAIELNAGAIERLNITDTSIFSQETVFKQEE